MNSLSILREVLDVRQLRTISLLTEVVLVALIYIITARIGQYFAIEPGNITPIWIPSGVMLAIVLIRGYHVWPGIFFGAFLGNIWAYIDFSSITTIISAIAAGLSNGIGDVICSLLPAWVLNREGNFRSLFNNLRKLSLFFAFGVFAGPAISALFGVLSLWACGIIETPGVTAALSTWSLGDAVGVMLFAPLIIYITKNHDISQFKAGTKELLILFFLLSLAPQQLGEASVIPKINYVYIMLPIMLWALFRLGLANALIIATYLTINELVFIVFSDGTFDQLNSRFSSLVALQIFVMVSISILLVISTVCEAKEIRNREPAG